MEEARTKHVIHRPEAIAAEALVGRCEPRLGAFGDRPDLRHSLVAEATFWAESGPILYEGCRVSGGPCIGVLAPQGRPTSESAEPQWEERQTVFREKVRRFDGPKEHHVIV